MDWKINKSSITVIWCILFWSIFAIQLVPRFLGGMLNVIIYFSFAFLFLKFSKGKIYWNIPLFLGILIYAFIVFMILNEKNKINIAGITINYSAYKMLFWVMGIICGSLFVRQANENELCKFRSVYFPIIVLNMFANLIITVFIDPTASKYAGKSSDYIVGVSDYDAVYSTVLIIPVLFYFMINAKKRERMKWVALCTIALLYVFKSTFFIAILACAIGIVLILLTRLQNATGKLFGTIIPIVTVVFFVIRNDLIFDIMLHLSSWINSPSISTRLIELVGVLRDGKDATDAVVRLDVYLKMLNGFLKHPFLGCIILEPEIYTSYAGHSTILDMLCGYGLFTCASLFWGFNKMIKSIRLRLLKEHQGVFQCCYLVFLFIALFNPVTNGYLMICTIVTVPYVLLYSSKLLNGELKT